jgi:hypothetical protein
MPRTPKEYHAFTSLMGRLLSVSKAEVDARQAAYKEQTDSNPRKRGPKPKSALRPTR